MLITLLNDAAIPSNQTSAKILAVITAVILMQALLIRQRPVVNLLLMASQCNNRAAEKLNHK